MRPSDPGNSTGDLPLPDVGTHSFPRVVLSEPCLTPGAPLCAGHTPGRFLRPARGRALRAHRAFTLPQPREGYDVGPMLGAVELGADRSDIDLPIFTNFLSIKMQFYMGQSDGSPQFTSVGGRAGTELRPAWFQTVPLEGVRRPEGGQRAHCMATPAVAPSPSDPPTCRLCLVPCLQLLGSRRWGVGRRGGAESGGRVRPPYWFPGG